MQSKNRPRPEAARLKNPVQSKNSIQPMAARLTLTKSTKLNTKHLLLDNCKYYKNGNILHSINNMFMERSENQHLV